MLKGDPMGCLDVVFHLRDCLSMEETRCRRHTKFAAGKEREGCYNAVVARLGIIVEGPEACAGSSGVEIRESLVIDNIDRRAARTASALGMAK